VVLQDFSARDSPLFARSKVWANQAWCCLHQPRAVVNQVKNPSPLHIVPHSHDACSLRRQSPAHFGKVPIIASLLLTVTAGSILQVGLFFASPPPTQRRQQRNTLGGIDLKLRSIQGRYSEMV
jgi:hypothetical protein